MQSTRRPGPRQGVALVAAGAAVLVAGAWWGLVTGPDDVGEPDDGRVGDDVWRWDGRRYRRS